MNGDIQRNGLAWSADASRLDVSKIHSWLGTTYWARHIPRDVVERAIAGSDCFGVYDGERQVAFARLVTDRATFAYLCDVYVDEEYRGRGIGRWLTETIQAQPEYQDLRRWMLVTRDAHSLYEKLGWTQVPEPSRMMQRHDPDIYSRRRDE